MKLLHTATREWFCRYMKQKETDYNVRMYACTRARVTVRRMDRPTVQPTDYANVRLPTRLSIKPIMNIVSVYDVPDFFCHGADGTHPTTDL